ncbi:fimbrial protein [Serratia fonticola]|uniref:fimbrial protein n=1 Tax=Serratia fonticola TaxID=47917 RepID=UPI0021BD8F48|nr:fimbrial protein [Serratia fonticola]
MGALVTMLTAGSVQAAENNVHLYGALVAEPCVIPPGEENIVLDFGTVIDKYLYLNNRTLGQQFSIHLTECDLSLGKTVSVTFLGTENVALPGLLAIDGGSQAKGIAIGLETKQAKPVPINQASDKYLLQDGDNRISLKAYVQGEPDAIRNQSIERGPFSATATFSLEYE